MTLTKLLRCSLAILLVGILLWGCASAANRQAQDLLLKNYQTMSDVELQSYYRQLNDTLAHLERERRQTSVGLGMASGSVGVGVTQGVSTPPDTQDLWDRANQVREELVRRGVMR